MFRLICGAMILVLLCAFLTLPDYTEVKVFNPYSSISLKFLVRCDYNPKTKKYKFHKIKILNSDSNTSIIVPNGLKKCEIWPIERKIFGKF